MLAIYKNSDGDLTYRWPIIEAAARGAGIDPDALKDFAFDAVDVETNADDLVAAYRDTLEADADSRAYARHLEAQS